MSADYPSTEPYAIRRRASRALSIMIALACSGTGCTLAQTVAYAGVSWMMKCSASGVNLNGASGLAQAPSGYIAIADTRNNRIVECDPSTGNTSVLPATVVSPAGLAFDSTGSLYIAEPQIKQVLEVYPDGHTSLVGGGYAQPTGVAVGPSGDVYVADEGASAVVHVSATGSEQDVLPLDLSHPRGISLDHQGNVYVVDSGNDRIVEWTVSRGTIIPNASLSNPSSVAVDLSGNLYVGDEGNSRVVEINAATQQEFQIGAAFSDPEAVILDRNGYLGIADSSISAISKINPGAVRFSDTQVGSTSRVSRFLFSFSDSVAVGQVVAKTLGINNKELTVVKDTCSSQMHAAGQTCWVDAAFSPQVAGNHMGAVELQDPSGVALADAFVSGVGVASRLGFHPSLPQSILAQNAVVYPTSVAFAPDGSYYVADYGNARILKVDTDGNQTDIIDANNPYVGFLTPTRVVLDGAGNLYISDEIWGHVVEVPIAGTPKELVGIFESIDGEQLGFPTGLAVDDAGTVLIADTYGNRIVSASEDGSTRVVISADVLIAGKALNAPEGVAVSPSGTVYVADTTNNRVISYATNGTATELVSSTTSINGTALNYPSDLALDAAQNLYILDSGNGRVVKWSPSGQIREFMGSNALTQSSWTDIQGMGFDPAGNLYLADAGDNSILMLNRAAPSLSFSANLKQSLVAENIGNTQLALSSVALTSGAGSFDLDGNTSTCRGDMTLAPRESCLVAITAISNKAGASGVLTFIDNSGNLAGASQAVALNEPEGSQPPAQIVVSGLSSQVTAGGIQTVAVAIEDQYGNLVPDYTGTVTFLSGDGRAQMPSNYTFTPQDGGRHSFPSGVMLGTAGLQTITVSSTDGILSGSENTYVVPGAPSQINAVAEQAQSTLEGSAFKHALLAKVTDALGNAVPGAPVTFISPTSGASATFGDNITVDTQQTDGTGVASESLTANEEAGSYTVEAQISGVSTPALFNVTNLVPSATQEQFTVATMPGSLAVQPGQSATAEIVVTPTPQFSGQIEFTCQNLPAKSFCSFAHKTMVLSPGTGVVSNAVTFTSPEAVPDAPHTPRGPASAAWVLPIGAVFGLLSIRRGLGHFRKASSLLLVITVILVGSLSGCGTERTAATEHVVKVVATVPSTGMIKQVMSISVGY